MMFKTDYCRARGCVYLQKNRHGKPVCKAAIPETRHKYLERCPLTGWYEVPSAEKA